jgi:MYXO-CTERM domain-containing protein
MTRLWAALCLSVPSLAAAFSSGISSVGAQGCNACHGGGIAPVVTVSASQTPVMPGASVAMTVTLTTPNGAHGGFNLAAAAGALSNPGPGAKILGADATHTQPKLEDAQGIVTFTASWTAPAAPGSYGFIAWGNSVDLNGNTSGDRAASASISVTVCTPQTFFVDADGDGFGNPGSSQQACSAPAGYVTVSGDCDDTDPARHPGATEVCNGVDDDCNGIVDDATGAGTSTYHADADGDGFGSSASTLTACSPPAGYVAQGGDCDDSDPLVHPGATEVCNGKDDNCNGQVDEGLPGQTWFQDADGDGVGGTLTAVACMQPAGYVAAGGDCDDTNPAVKPGATELCNGKDDDCDGLVDEGALLTFYRDADGDGFGSSGDTAMACTAPAGYVAVAGDCDDGRGDVHPGAMETCDGVDEDCDGVVDDGVPKAVCGLGVCQRTGTTCHPSSCTVGLPSIESCNGLDDDCDGIADNDADALCPGADVCTPLADAGAHCAVPDPQPDAGTTDAGTDDGGLDAGVTADGGDGGSEGAGCGCAAAPAGALWPMVGLLLCAVASRRRRASQT